MANRGRVAAVWSVVALWAGALATLACGSRAMPNGSDPDEDSPVGAGSDAPGGRGGSGSGSVPLEPGVPIDLDRVTLPPCSPGFLPGSAGDRDCTYIFRQQCFREPLAACACACSGSEANSCIIGGFLNPDEPQSVICISL